MINRRNLLAAYAALPLAALARRLPYYTALAFDGFPIFDPRPIAVACEKAFPGNGEILLAAWRTRQFEYQWLSTLMGEYIDFIEATEAGLEHAAESLNLPLTSTSRTALVNAYRWLPVWPDVVAGVQRLSSAGVRLSVVSNMTTAMLQEGLSRAGLAKQFEVILSTEELRRHKPERTVYERGAERLKLPTSEVLFVPFAAWDLAGASAAGHPVFWLNRTGMPNERLGHAAKGHGRSFQSLVDFVLPAGT